LSRLAETFNAMLGRWQGAFANVARLTADASHELRTPVTLARTTAELALSRPRTTDEYRTALAEVLALTERMSLLVGDLLMLARADAGVEPHSMASVDISGVVSDAVRDLQGAADRKSIRMSVSAPSVPMSVEGIRESLQRLLVIVLDNAVTYTPAGGSVSVRIGPASHALPRQIVVEVVDSGVGIDAADRSRVFDRFHRGAVARDLSPDGAGLGLSIGKTIVDSHRGDISVGDAPSGQGCRVMITLPAA
jgi:signal transduction histidine kinase